MLELNAPDAVRAVAIMARNIPRQYMLLRPDDVPLDACRRIRAHYAHLVALGVGSKYVSVVTFLQRCERTSLAEDAWSIDDPSERAALAILTDDLPRLQAEAERRKL